MVKIIILLATLVTLWSFPCFAGDEFDPKLFEQSMRKISAEAAREADIATKPEWDKIKKRQDEDIKAIWETVKLMNRGIDTRLTPETVSK